MEQINIEAKVIEISPVKEFTKFGKQGRVAIAIIETIDKKNKKEKLTLWDEQIDLIKTGDKIKIINGYIKEWKGQKSINVSKYGKLEIIN